MRLPRPLWVPLIVVTAGLALPAASELLEIDFAAEGDGLITRDTETGLDWFDPAESATAGGAWTVATTAQICDLFETHLGMVAGCPNTGPIGEFVDPSVAEAFSPCWGSATSRARLRRSTDSSTTARHRGAWAA